MITFPQRLIRLRFTATILGKDDWKKETVNGTHSHTIKGLKPGMSYRVRVVAKDGAGQTVSSTNEVVVTVPGEAACLTLRHVFFRLFCFCQCCISPIIVIKWLVLPSYINISVFVWNMSSGVIESFHVNCNRCLLFLFFLILNQWQDNWCN